MKRSLALRICVILVMTTASFGQDQPQPADRGQRAYPPNLPTAPAEVYKTVGDSELRIYIFEPEEHQPTDERAAIVFFFGGGWRSGSPQQFEKYCEYFASRGMVAMTADYRVSSGHDVKAVDCVKDAKSAIRWVRANARRLGVDPDRIVASGGSAGGHIAACAAVIEEIEPDGEELSVSSVPNALVLFNPAMTLAPIGDAAETHDPEQMRERTGVDPKAISPAHHVRKDQPPTIMFFGADDSLLDGAEAFCGQAKDLGNRCEIRTWDGKEHSFFNFGREGNEAFVETTQAADEFLQSLEYLTGEANVADWLHARK